METKHEAIAAHFNECARLLREHPELFDDRALEHVGLAAGLSVRTTRLAARGHSLVAIVRELSGALVTAVAADAGLRGGSLRGADRVVLGLLAGARRGYVAAAERATLLERRRNPPMQFSIGESANGRPTMTSPCPRCGAVATRDLAAPDPCAACGFAFAAVG